MEELVAELKEKYGSESVRHILENFVQPVLENAEHVARLIPQAELRMTLTRSDLELGTHPSTYHDFVRVAMDVTISNK